jgi:hypothetical protein
MKSLIKRNFKVLQTVFYQIKNTYSPPQKIILLHAGRCGSTVLSSYFNADSRFFWEGEAIQFYFRRNQKNGNRFPFDDNPLGFILNLAKKSPKPFHGVEVKALENIDFSLENMPDSFVDFQKWAITQNYKLILLYRENILRQVISTLIAFHFDLWHQNKKINKKVENKKVQINLQKVINNHDYSLIEYLDLFSNFNNFCKNQSSNQILVLNFEKDILINPIQGYKKAMEFLNLRPSTTTSSFKRVNPESISQLVENYDELKNYLKDTPYFNYLIE